MFHPAGNVVPHTLSQTVIVVSRVVDREKAAVFGVEQKQEPVEENQRRVTDLLKTFAGFPDQGIDQSGEYPLENNPGKVLGNLLLVPPPFGDRRFEEGGRGPISQGE